jgi:hypothetical protein
VSRDNILASGILQVAEGVGSYGGIESFVHVPSMSGFPGGGCAALKGPVEKWLSYFAKRNMFATAARELTMEKA